MSLCVLSPIPDSENNIFGILIYIYVKYYKVTFTEEHISFLHFLTNVCAIVGGNLSGPLKKI